MPEQLPAFDTIVAISTPPGRGGIGIVRLAGPEALRVAELLIRHSGELEHGRVRRAEVLDPSETAGDGVQARTMDEAMVTAFLAPHSYTGDTLVEIAAHGSPVVLEAMVRGALEHGARLALAVRLAAPGG